MRTTYVIRDGALVDVNEASPRVPPPEHLHRSRVQIQPDIEVHRAPDGTLITSRAEQREWCKRTGNIEFGGASDFRETSWKKRYENCHPSKAEIIGRMKANRERPSSHYRRVMGIES